MGLGRTTRTVGIVHTSNYVQKVGTRIAAKDDNIVLGTFQLWRFYLFKQYEMDVWSTSAAVRAACSELTIVVMIGD